MTTTALPHDLYITAVTEALTAAGLPLAENTWTDEAETVGTYCHLNAVITLDPDRTTDLDHDDIPAAADWPHGLILIWEWHTGLEEGTERGPIWLFAEVHADGSNDEPGWLPVDGYASPTVVVEAARAVIARTITSTPSGTATGDYMPIPEQWEHVDLLDAACTAWGEDEDDGPAEAQASTPGAARSERLLATSTAAGPHAARAVATRHAAVGTHSHLSADGEVECLSRICPPTTLPTG